MNRQEHVNRRRHGARSAPARCEALQQLQLQKIRSKKTSGSKFFARL